MRREISVLSVLVFFSLSPKKAVTMKPSLKQQFVSQEPGEVDCNGGRREAEGDWLLELPPLVLEALFNS